MEEEWDTEDHLWEVGIMVVVVLEEEEVDMEEVDMEDEEGMGEDVECRVIGGHLSNILPISAVVVSGIY